MAEVRLIDANAVVEEICKDCNAIKEKESGERSNRSMEQEYLHEQTQRGSMSSACRLQKPHSSVEG